MWRSLAVSVLSIALPLTANAIPILRLALTGDASRLGAGAISPFTVYSLDALHLDRPALLTDITQPLLRLEVAQEKTIEMDGPQFFEGTRARDEQALLIVVVPTRIFGRRLTLLASGELREGLLRIEDKTDGLITQINEHRGRGSFGVAFEPWSRLRIGAAGSFSDGFSGAVEAIGTFGPFQLGAQQRNEDLGYTLKIPKGPPAKLQRPELDYPIHAQRQTSTLTARLQTSWTDSAVSLDIWTRDPVVDSALFIVPGLTLRGHYEQLHLEFDNWASNKGVPVARINLDMVVSRWAANCAWGGTSSSFASDRRTSPRRAAGSTTARSRGCSSSSCRSTSACLSSSCSRRASRSGAWAGTGTFGPSLPRSVCSACTFTTTRAATPSALRSTWPSVAGTSWHQRSSRRSRSPEALLWS